MVSQQPALGQIRAQVRLNREFAEESLVGICHTRASPSVGDTPQQKVNILLSRRYQDFIIANVPKRVLLGINFYQIKPLKHGNQRKELNIV